MNYLHRRLCAAKSWGRFVSDTLVPRVLDGVDLGDDVLELGPGPGLTTDELADRVPRLTALELDPQLAARLTDRMGREHPAVTVVQGDATAMPFDDGRFSSAVCFTMLHHVPSADLQDRLFAEAHRILRPGGVFAGTDNRGTGFKFWLIHLHDTLTPVDPATLPARLEHAGFHDVEVTGGSRTVFRAVA